MVYVKNKELGDFTCDEEKARYPQRHILILKGCSKLQASNILSQEQGRENDFIASQKQQ